MYTIYSSQLGTVLYSKNYSIKYSTFRNGFQHNQITDTFIFNN